LIFRGRVHHAVIATLNTGVILVAWDENESAPTEFVNLGGTPRRQAESANLSAIIDGIADEQLQVGAGGNQGVQIY
jgi:hypothetical protein